MEVVNMEKNVEVALLFSFYRNMLTDRQAESIDLHYNEDLSLSEISQHMDITRQGCEIISSVPSIPCLRQNKGLDWLADSCRFRKSWNILTMLSEKLNNLPIFDIFRMISRERLMRS